MQPLPDADPRSWHDQINHTLAARIRAARRFRRLPATRLARRAGLSDRRVRAIEQAAEDMTAAEFEAIAAALELPVGHFAEQCALCGR